MGRLVSLQSLCAVVLTPRTSGRDPVCLQKRQFRRDRVCEGAPPRHAWCPDAKGAFGHGHLHGRNVLRGVG